MSRDGQALLLFLVDRPVDGISQITVEFPQFRRDLSQHPQILMPAQMFRQIFQEPDPDVGAAANRLPGLGPGLPMARPEMDERAGA